MPGYAETLGLRRASQTLDQDTRPNDQRVKDPAALTEEVGFKFTSFMADIAKRFIS
jgi:hypothetical protein